MSMKTVILVKKFDGQMRPYWHKWGTYENKEIAEVVYETTIRGKGITAWAELVSEEEAKRMML